MTLNVREGSEWAVGYRAPRSDFPVWLWPDGEPAFRGPTERSHREADVKRSESKTQLRAVVLPEEATFRHWPWLDRHRALRLRRHLKFPDCGKTPAPLYLRKGYWIWQIRRGECRRAVVVGTVSVFTVVVVAEHYGPFLYKHGVHLPRQQTFWWKVIIKILSLKSFGKFKTSIPATTDHPMYNLSAPTHRMVPETGRVSLLCLWPLRTAAGSSGWLPDYSKANYSQRHPDHLHLLLWCEPVRQRQNMRENLNNAVPDISWIMCAWAAVTWFFSTIKDCFRAPVVVWPLL